MVGVDREMEISVDAHVDCRSLRPRLPHIVSDRCSLFEKKATGGQALDRRRQSTTMKLLLTGCLCFADASRTGSMRNKYLALTFNRSAFGCINRASSTKSTNPSESRSCLKDTEFGLSKNTLYLYNRLV